MNYGTAITIEEEQAQIAAQKAAQEQAAREQAAKAAAAQKSASRRQNAGWQQSDPLPWPKRSP